MPWNSSQTVFFGEWLRQRRKALDLTQEQLAERIGCSPDTIRKIELGVRRPSRQVADLLADLFQVPVEDREAFINFARRREDANYQASAWESASGH
jgi:transcriptional regulator with XRE-family HTH domain